MALALAISAAPVSDGADGTDDATTITLGEFITKVADANYDYDGQGITVSWIPTSACTLSNHSTDDSECLFKDTSRPTGDGNNPGRVQNNNAQYNIFDNQQDVTIKNVNFVYAYADTDPEFTLCQQARGDEYTGTFGYEKARNAELQFLNDGDLTITGCTFDRVIVSPFSCYGKTTITECKFSNVYNAYTIKDVYSETATIKDCEFSHCSGGIYFEGTNTKGTYTIEGNTFDNMDSYAADGKENTRGLIQFSKDGDYGNSKIIIKDNEYSGDTPIIRQLNPTITPEILDPATIKNSNSFVGDLFVAGSVSVDDTDQNPDDSGTPGWSDDDEELPPMIRPGASSSEDDSVTIVACAAAAVVAALMAVFLIVSYKKE